MPQERQARAVLWLIHAGATCSIARTAASLGSTRQELALIHRQHRQDQMRGMLRVVIDGVGADLVGPIEVPEQSVGHRRVPAAQLEAYAIALAKAVGHRLE